jgi:dihydrolipoamide dehydrogenase
MVMGELEQETQVLVIGGGPGGYAAAFRAADLGLEVTLVDPAARPGGVCLYDGCIPSKTLLFLSELIYDAGRARQMGITFGPPRLDLGALRQWKGQVIDSMSAGLEALCRRRGIQLLRAEAQFENAHRVRLTAGEIRRITFKQAIIATGSQPLALPGSAFAAGSRIMSSSGALALADVPERLLVVGGGYVGLELGSVYAALGSRVDLVELGTHILPEMDEDLVAPLKLRLESTFASIHLGTSVTTLNETATGVDVCFEGNPSIGEMIYDRVLVAIGRRPASGNIGIENTGVQVDGRGFIVVDEQQRTAETHIFAVGDITGGVMLAHKATREGKVAAEVIAGRPSAFDVRAIPAVVYTDPQIAWCGLTETAARRENRPVKIQRFPWKYSGRAATMGATEGLTKLIIDPENGRILGAGITGRQTEGLIAEAVLAIEMGALAEDMALSIHPHPTLSETESEAAELFLGSATHML